jgi:hypothetical protein
MNRITRLACAAGALVFLSPAMGWAQLVQLESGSAWSIAPGPDRPCLVGISERQVRLATRVEGDCVFDGNTLRARVFATAGPGIQSVDVSSEVKVVVAQFVVPAPTGAPTSYLPFHAIVPVSWTGQFFNMTAGVFHATGSVNMFLRLRHGNAADVNFAGTLISQARFQGASHGGLNQCLTVPTDYVSAAEGLVGCALAVVQRDSGDSRVELAGVIRTGQVYNLELVIRGDLLSPFVNDPIDAYIPERIAFDEDRGLSWRENATLRIGSDPEASLEGLRQELAELKAAFEALRSDFDGHYHTYLTGNGPGHNRIEAATPPPQHGSGAAAVGATSSR